ncbi:putative PNT domain-containing protein [Phytophthora infestans]|nr:putative PNT domain-containing protein [Phytophthora infestans]
MSGKNVLVKGRFEFVLERGNKKVFIVEAKKEDMEQGVVQNVTGLEALADVEELSVTYGIVTNYLEWRFLVSEDERVRKQVYSLSVSDTLPSFAGLKKVVGTIHCMLSNNQ